MDRPRASIWLSLLERPDGAVRRRLVDVYGNDGSVIQERTALLRRALRVYLARFGDDRVRVFRAPGRLNLRGMHVDTHGGYLNLMTHHRETVVVGAPSNGSRCVLINVDPDYEEVAFDRAEAAGALARARTWEQMLQDPETRRRVSAQPGHWGNYVRGTLLRAEQARRGPASRGLRAVVGGDLPSGAGLSSSHALCTALLYAALGLTETPMKDEERILAVRDAEWYAGARSGVSDQGAMVLCRRGELVNAALFAPDLDLRSARRLEFPDAVCVLVIHSHTRRSLSGAHLVEYTRNRFAYSLAMDIVRREMERQGAPAEFSIRVDRLARLTPEHLEPIGGLRALYGLLRAIPESLEIDELRRRYAPAQFEALYDQYFGSTAPEDRPVRIALRGPLLFGIAESERAQVFFDLLAEGDFTSAGRLMTLGHEGDRRIGPDGRPVQQDISDARLARAEAEATPVELLAGDYGASSPALDVLVDAAVAGGALGASLTGAGIAGSVLALCRRQDAERVAQRVRARMRAPDYHELAGRPAPIADGDIENAVVVNRAISGAGELVMGHGTIRM